MSPSTRTLLALAIAAGSIAPVWAAKDDPAADLAKITNGRIAGKPQHCIDLPRVSNTQVIDNTTIAYRVGATWYINTLRSGGPGLDANSILVTKTFGAQLCELDTVNLVDRYGGGLRGFVILGPFVPYKAAPKAR